MNTFKFVISSPDGNVFDEEIVKVSMRGAEGDFAIMARHIPFITTVKSGECKVELSDGEEKKGTLDGGLLTVAKETVTLLSGSFKWK